MIARTAQFESCATPPSFHNLPADTGVPPSFTCKLLTGALALGRALTCACFTPGRLAMLRDLSRSYVSVSTCKGQKGYQAPCCESATAKSDLP